VRGSERNVGGNAKWGVKRSGKVEGAHSPFAEHVVIQLNRSWFHFPS
jgi:hypothetical protein